MCRKRQFRHLRPVAPPARRDDGTRPEVRRGRHRVGPGRQRLDPFDRSCQRQERLEVRRGKRNQNIRLGAERQGLLNRRRLPNLEIGKGLRDQPRVDRSFPFHHENLRSVYFLGLHLLTSGLAARPGHRRTGVVWTATSRNG